MKFCTCCDDSYHILGKTTFKSYPKRFKTGHLNYFKSNFTKASGKIKILFSTLNYYFEYYFINLKTLFKIVMVISRTSYLSNFFRKQPKSMISVSKKRN